MTRFFFHTKAGRCVPDEHGVELADLDAVRAMSLKTMCEMSSALALELWHEGALRVPSLTSAASRI